MAQAPVQSGKNGVVVAEATTSFHDGRGRLEDSAEPGKMQRAAASGPLKIAGVASASALACLETRVALADHENLAATAHDLAVTMPLLGGLERRKHFHGGLGA
jgi:hypothetical protein